MLMEKRQTCVHKIVDRMLISNSKMDATKINTRTKNVTTNKRNMVPKHTDKKILLVRVNLLTKVTKIQKEIRVQVLKNMTVEIVLKAYM